jgi:photosystem II stability/assembly factor-like uncharacterized protein
MKRRLALLACVLIGIAQALVAPAAASRPQASAVQLTCATYGYSLAIGSDWTVKNPCTTSTIINTPFAFALAISLRHGAGWNIDAAKSDVQAFVATLNGYAPVGSTAFSTPTINGRRWSLGVAELKNVAGNAFTLSALETFNRGLIYTFIALVAVQGDAQANARIAQIVHVVFASIKLNNTATPAPAATVTPGASPTPVARTSVAGLPMEMVGTWQAESLSGISFVDTLGNYAPPTGSIVQFAFAASGAFTWDGLLQVSRGSCAHNVFAYETGAASLDTTHLTLIPHVNTLTSRDNCGARADTKQQRSLAKQVYRWKLDQLQRGSKLCLLQLGTPKAQPVCYWLQGSPLARIIKADATWTKRYSDPTGSRIGLSGVSCPSMRLCVAVGYDGILTSADGGTSWTRRMARDQAIGFGPSSVSCPSESLCVAAGNGLLISTDGGIGWTPVTGLASNTVLNSVSCASASLCVAVGAGGVILTGTHTGWTLLTGAPTNDFDTLRSVSCASAALCMALGDGGIMLTSVDGSASWSRRSSTLIKASGLGGVSCPSVHLCVAAGDGILISADGGASWKSHAPGIDNILEGNALHTVSCLSAGLCAAVGESGTILTSADGGVTWTSQVALGSDQFATLNGVSCAAAGACVAVGEAGPGGSLILQATR